ACGRQQSAAWAGRRASSATTCGRPGRTRGPAWSSASARLLDLEQLQAADARRPLAVALVHLARLGVLHHHRPGPDDAVLADLQVVADAAVHAQEAALADFAIAGDDDVRRHEAVVLNDAAVPDVVAAPQHHVVTDLGVVLDDVLFEDEAILADR